MKTADLPRVLDRLELLQDEWGYLLIWATLGVATLTATVLLAIPVIWGWRTIFSRSRGKALTVLYFACLGAGYIMVEVGLIAHFVMALGNPTISASVLITGMLVFSGLGALTSERILPRMRTVMPPLFLAIGGLLILYALFINHALDAIGALPYAARLVCGFMIVAPPAFLMGFPMPTAMTTLGRLGKNHMFIWAWGVNGCFSVIGAAAAPVIATNFGLGAVIEIAGVAYLLALPAFFGVIAVDKSRRAGLNRGGFATFTAPSPDRHITVLQRNDDAARVVAEHKISMIVKTLLIKRTRTAGRVPIRAPATGASPSRRFLFAIARSDATRIRSYASNQAFAV